MHRLATAAIGVFLIVATLGGGYPGLIALCLSFLVAYARLPRIGVSRWWSLCWFLIGPYLVLVLAWIPDREDRSRGWSARNPWVLGAGATALFAVAVIGFNLSARLGLHSAP